ncbi:putative cytochrome c heme lyase subunit CcmH [Pseudomonas aeruginosa]|nr:putative cytochrome c heme lyase subunit CcmH [Pseudomonas aeruginosa]
MRGASAADQRTAGLAAAAKPAAARSVQRARRHPPRITPQPQTPAQPSRSRPQFAPPPGGKGVWDGSLGVYVIRGERDLYYRQRTYYRWDGGWFWSTSPQGPWTETDARGIPPGLSRRYANP